MKERLVSFLACPDCNQDLSLVPASVERDGDEIITGTLACAGCHREYPILRGVPRLLPSGLESLAADVAEGFGWQWNQFSELRPEYAQQFLDWVHPLGPDDFRGKRVIEGGCGKGRHARIVAEFGAKDIFCVDLGSAVEACFRNVGRRDAVHVIQGDISRLPLKRVADVAFSVGVVHHMPEPIEGVRGLAAKVVEGGRISVWVYGYEGNEWYVRIVNPVREQITSRMPRRALYELSKPLGWIVAAASKGLYAPAQKLAPRLHDHLFYKDYLTYIARLPTREIHTIVFDQLVTPVAYYLRHDEVEALFAPPADGPGYRDLTIERHNANSWRANAYITDAPRARV